MQKQFKTPVKIVSALITLSVSVNLAAAFDEPANEEPADTHIFTDIELGDKHYVAIKYLKENGLIQGYEDGSFKPLNEINRAEALKILAGALTDESTEQPSIVKEPATPEETTDTTDSTESTITLSKLPPPAIEETDNQQFSPDDTATVIETETIPQETEGFQFADVPKDAWFYDHVLFAWKKQVVEGYPDGLFHPENTINRAESLKIALLLEGGEIPSSINEPPYADVPVDAWFTPYAQVSSERSLIIRSRTDGSLYPAQNMNRGDFADLVYRMIKSQNGNRFAVATWYGFDDVNWSTASGEAFDTNLPTAAHKTLPFGTIIKVTNLANGKSVNVKINDRGPYAQGIDLDLTSSSFKAIASLGAGVIVTEFEIVSEPGEETESSTTNSETSNEIEYRF